MLHVFLKIMNSRYRNYRHLYKRKQMHAAYFEYIELISLGFTRVIFSYSPSDNERGSHWHLLYDKRFINFFTGKCVHQNTPRSHHWPHGRRDKEHRNLFSPCSSKIDKKLSYILCQQSLSFSWQLIRRAFARRNVCCCNITFQLILVISTARITKYLSICLYRGSDNCPMPRGWLLGEFSRHTRLPSESLIFRKRDRSGPFTFDPFRDSTARSRGMIPRAFGSPR